MCLSYSFCRYATLAVLFWTVLKLSLITTQRLESNTTTAHKDEANPLYLKEHVHSQPYNGLFEFDSSMFLSGDEPPEVKGSYEAIVNALNKDVELSLFGKVLAYYHLHTQARQYNRCNRRWQNSQGQTKSQHALRPNRTVVVIVGLPQSGNSFLHRLMSLLPGKDGKPVFRTPTFWEYYSGCEEKSARLIMSNAVQNTVSSLGKRISSLMLSFIAPFLGLSQYVVGNGDTVTLILSGLIDTKHTTVPTLASLFWSLEQPTKRIWLRIQLPQTWIAVVDRSLDHILHVLRRWILSMEIILTRYFVPNLAKTHIIEVDEPGEDTQVLGNTGLSMLAATSFYVPSYIHWLRNDTDLKAERSIQYLDEFLHREIFPSDPFVEQGRIVSKYIVLKSPWHLIHLKQMVESFKKPARDGFGAKNIKFVWIHRRVDDTWASIDAMNQIALGTTSARGVNGKHEGYGNLDTNTNHSRFARDTWTWALQRAWKHRHDLEQVHSSLFLDIDSDALRADPSHAINTILRFVSDDGNNHDHGDTTLHSIVDWFKFSRTNL